jgi:hypothetical protein
MSDKVTMTALDTLHISNVHADNLVEGDTFRVSEADAKFTTGYPGGAGRRARRSEGDRRCSREQDASRFREQDGFCRLLEPRRCKAQGQVTWLAQHAHAPTPARLVDTPRRICL